jgi:hypothetical protein
MVIGVDMKTSYPCRPDCPKCEMNMLGITSPDKAKTYQCLRCGHVEARKTK